ncbi:MAG: hypothetical protein ABIB71_04815 [Candidatus Woesearchaeota archaeon]
MIVGVVALARAGKDVFSDYLVKNYGYKKVNTSDVLRDSLMKSGQTPTKDGMSRLADEWRKQFGMDIVTRRSLEGLRDYKQDIVLLGFRSPEEVDLARSIYGEKEFVLVGITADKDTRYNRRSPDDPQDKEGFFARDERDIKNKGLEKAIEMAQHVLINNDTLENFYYKINNLMKVIS